MKIIKKILAVVLIVGICAAVFYYLDFNKIGNTITQKISYIPLSDEQNVLEENQIYYFNNTQLAPTSLPLDNTTTEQDDTVYGHCYSKMDARQRLYYRLILSAFEDMSDTFFEVSCNDQNYKNNLHIAYTGVLNDNPEIFWHNNTYEIKVSEDNVCELKLGFSITKQERDQRRKLLNTTVDEIIAATDKLSDFEKEIYFYELLCKKTEYTQIDGNTEYTSFGALCKGEAVCEGYAKAMQLLCKRSGIECLLVRGVTDGAHHIWNLIKLSDGWYELDVTLSDRPNNTPNYLFFNATSEEISVTHNRLQDIANTDNSSDFSSLTYNFYLPETQGSIYNRDAANEQYNYMP